MFFILRMMFWIAIVALLLPAAPEPHGQIAAAKPEASTFASKAISAALSYCSASPDKCAAGMASARRIEDLLVSSAAAPGNETQTALVQRMVALPPPRPAIP